MITENDRWIFFMFNILKFLLIISKYTLLLIILNILIKIYIIFNDKKMIMLVELLSRKDLKQ